MGARFRLRAARARECQPVLFSFPGFRPVPSFCLPEGGGAPDRRNVTRGTSKKAPARRLRAAGAPPGAPPRRFLTQPPYFFAGARSVDSHVIQAPLALPFIRARRSHSRQPPHRGRTVTAPPGTGLRNPRLQAPPSPLRRLAVTRRRPP